MNLWILILFTVYPLYLEDKCPHGWRHCPHVWRRGMSSNKFCAKGLYGIWKKFKFFFSIMFQHDTSLWNNFQPNAFCCHIFLLSYIVYTKFNIAAISKRLTTTKPPWSLHSLYQSTGGEAWWTWWMQQSFSISLYHSLCHHSA